MSAQTMHAPLVRDPEAGAYERAGTPDPSRSCDESGTRGAPGAPDAPGVSGAAGAPDPSHAFSGPGTLGVPAVPGTAGAPDSPRELDASGTVRAPGASDVPSTADASGASGASSESGVPNTPRTHGASGAAIRGRTPLAGLSRLNTRALRTHFGTAAGVAILAVLLWRLGTGVFLDGLRRIDAPTLLAALGIGLVTTVFSAWRWQLVARGLGIRLPLGPAVADYYRALFLNAALPGGVLGDVHRAVRHGRSTGDLGRGVRAVVLERVAGQIALAVTGAAVLLTLPSPVRDQTRHLAAPVALAAAGAFAVVLALRLNRAPSRRGRALRRALAEAREGLLSRRNGPGVALSSAVVLAGHIGMFMVAAHVAGSSVPAGPSVPVIVLLPLAVLALVAMGLPLNVGGFGPREGVAAWAFGAAGLGASSGVAVAVVYGVLSFVAGLPGAFVLVARWYAAMRAGSRPAEPAAEPGHASGGTYARPLSGSSESSEPSDVSSEKYAPKESTRLFSSFSPFSAEPREGRPMTPDSV